VNAIEDVSVEHSSYFRNVCKVFVLSVPVTAMKVLRREERVWAAGC
jgi:hypothetical protein